MASEQKAQKAPSSNPLDRLLGWFGLYRDASGTAQGMGILWWEAVGYGSFIVIGLAMRLWDLGSRALHHDESLHALYSWNLFSGLGYQHNPMMHGPFQFEANALLFHAFGDSDVTSRLLYVIMGTILIAMPLLFRRRLGRMGALLTAGLMTASPALLYYSRFARNDILMAVWTFGLVICMWRYFDEGKARYLYISAGLLALAFATKESAYLVAATLGLWSALLALQPSIGKTLKPIEIQGVSPPAAIGRVISGIWAQNQDRLDLRTLSRPAAFLLFLITITLPQWSAFISVFQDTALLSWTNLVFAAHEGSARIGDPIGGANVIAFILVVGLIGVSAYFGYRWNWSVWWKSAVIFYAIWTLLYTTFLSNFYGGIKSGIWQSLGYWVVQQGEARGNQPWYYYFVITSIYEFLAFFVGVIAIVYFIRKRDRFSMFLVFWPITTFLFYTIASEKMPWLLVNIALPFLVLVGKFLADLVRQVEWRRVFQNGGYFLIPSVPLFVILLWNLALFSPTEATAQNILIPLAIGIVLVAMGVSGIYSARRIGYRNFLSVSLFGVVAVLLVLTVRSGVIASYENGDTPVEMLVYTQTSPDVTQLIDIFEDTGVGTNMTLAIDGTSGFTWPWAWYFRNDDRVHFPVYNSGSFGTAPNEPVVIVHSNNRRTADEDLRDLYLEGERVRHRWWFPESTYRGLTPTKFVKAIFDRSSWRRAMDYWLHRDGVRDRLASENSYVYFRPDIPQNYQGEP